MKSALTGLQAAENSVYIAPTIAMLVDNTNVHQREQSMKITLAIQKTQG